MVHGPHGITPVGYNKYYPQFVSPKYSAPPLLPDQLMQQPKDKPKNIINNPE